MQEPEGHGCCEPHQPARHGRLGPSGVFGCLALSEDVGSPAYQLTSGVGEREPPGRTVDEARAEPPLNSTDSFGNGRLGKLQLRRRPREGTKLHDLRKNG